MTGGARFALNGLAVSVLLAFASPGYALPSGGAVSAGGASIVGAPGKLTINQSSQNVAINWQSFSIAPAEAVQFVQPNSSSVALNRVLGSDPSSILGSLSANGKVFLVNPNGILFGKGAQVNVGGLVASTRNITDSDFMSGNYKFAGSGNGAVLNQGTINADSGYVALLGASVSNEGVISARLGTVALAAGNAMTLDVAGDGLLNVAVNEGALNALVQNGGLIRADGGQVLLSALSAGNLIQSAVNNSGVVQAQTVENHNGTIRLMGDMQSGTVNAGGTLDASAPDGGNGGFIETSAARVNFANDVKITTAAASGRAGTFLIDPLDFTIGSAIGDNISGLNLQNLLVNNNVVISTVPSVSAFVDGQPHAVPLPVVNMLGTASGAGDINVNESVTWTPPGISTTTLTLNAFNDVNVGVGVAISGTRGNVVVCCGRDINVRGTITTVNGSILLSAGRDITLSAAATMTATDGNITACAGRNINVFGTITVTNGSVTAGQSLGLQRGLVLSAGNAATGPGPAGGTVNFGLIDATVNAAPTFITYNPISYTVPTDYSVNIIGLAPTQFMLVYPDGADKAFDGTTAATFTGFKSTATSGSVPAGVTLAGPGTAAFDTPDAGQGKIITFSGFTLTQNPITAGPAAINFALPAACCGPAIGRTTGNIAGGTTGASTVQTVPVLPLLGLPMLAGLDLSIGGITMPPILVAEETPVETGAIAQEIVAPPEVVVPPVPPPMLPPRPARN